MRSVPPAVTHRTLGGPAYLLAWEQHPDRTWWARVIWVEATRDGYTAWHGGDGPNGQPYNDATAAAVRRLIPVLRLRGR